MKLSTNYGNKQQTNSTGVEFTPNGGQSNNSAFSSFNKPTGNEENNDQKYGYKRQNSVSKHYHSNSLWLSDLIISNIVREEPRKLVRITCWMISKSPFLSTAWTIRASLWKMRQVIWLFPIDTKIKFKKQMIWGQSKARLCAHLEWPKTSLRQGMNRASIIIHRVCNRIAIIEIKITGALRWTSYPPSRRKLLAPKIFRRLTNLAALHQQQ